MTTDFTLEGRHFRRDWHPPESVGHRALARGLSDLAAMGARPLAAFLSLALPGGMLGTRRGRRWVERFFAGLRGLASHRRCRWPVGTQPNRLGTGARGHCAGGRPRRAARCGAVGGRPGDALYVTGELGGAAAELAAMERRGARKRSTSPCRMHHRPRSASAALPAAPHRRRTGTAAAGLATAPSI